ncbi:DUF2267 domain-containing protein [Streptomyces sp. SP17BM10]|uniref:DUF2267 domain-containing protein n=1 Tax=Streptomyces sp. SP17BM10 TaxID=3002530 RepID=UPI002E7A5A05|nr:DUF2267 domain-containing protein [Streptomyces sp. SP17BM10]MEE1783811.1 DUF2267 domain-containing protein [Streptomyces sp. SP17BM10]
MTRHSLVQHVRELGRYSSDQEAEQVLETVLGILGSQLTGEERCALAAALPEHARAAFVAPIPLDRPVTAPAFAEAVARTLHTTLAGARWDASCVLTALADLAGNQLTDRLLAYLPRGYALLFGRADLTPAAA